MAVGLKELRIMAVGVAQPDVERCTNQKGFTCKIQSESREKMLQRQFVLGVLAACHTLIHAASDDPFIWGTVNDK
jgi:hypothetical protein